MKSIYSVETLQRILDHYGVGTLTYVTYFASIGRQIWRHHIETTRGEFGLYSFPPTEVQSYVVDQVDQSPGGKRGIILPLLTHCFDRHHLLKLFAKKIPLSKHQIEVDVERIQNLQLSKIFRVYGTILQAQLSDGTVWCSYARWRLKSPVENENLDTLSATKEKIDAVIDFLSTQQLLFQGIDISGQTICLQFSKGYTFYFQSYSHFAALELRIANTTKNIHITSERSMCYLVEF